MRFSIFPLVFLALISVASAAPFNAASINDLRIRGPSAHVPGTPKSFENSAQHSCPPSKKLSDSFKSKLSQLKTKIATLKGEVKEVTSSPRWKEKVDQLKRLKEEFGDWRRSGKGPPPQHDTTTIIVIDDNNNCPDDSPRLLDQVGRVNTEISRLELPDQMDPEVVDKFQVLADGLGQIMSQIGDSAGQFAGQAADFAGQAAEVIGEILSALGDTP
ncbi:hypothetical protein F5879DRAFT_958546 [Lentinula edodes]|uniref:uncharacterized protein n=1 Tax=Lentinula edodes TaxID=5353 RepID=UPI001E8E1381|nr:uncharacterized protein C8R40DRAFT_1164972 [Lentinula edodes]KAH7881561.1 hypothetical protein C8R40DRAFT_1164972 [Lentinula edodes]KAJ3903683.1 hypothetical protein F5879DRAFT_958546 [Lentinula edodes]